jgi:uncharacterized 2Fe-2S/4Fe-4S cluster protein (DUF4445 family)
MYCLNIRGQETKHFFNGSTGLLEMLHKNKIVLETPCNGKGICGKCKVRIISGIVNKPTAEELEKLTQKELEQGFRLGCMLEPASDLLVEPPVESYQKNKILTDGVTPDFKINPVVTKKVHYIDRLAMENIHSYQDLLYSLFENPPSIEDPDILRRLPEIFSFDQITAIYNGDKIIGVEPGDTSEQTYGLAIDLGTTTVILTLVDLHKGQEVGTESEINPQKDYGLDVLSRIDFAARNDNGLALLHDIIINCLNQLTDKLCSKYNLPVERIYDITVSANATMMHLFLGVNPGSIGKTPYTPVFSGPQQFSAASLGLKSSPFARVYCLAGISGYIGSDIVSGILASELDRTKKTALFIDIGTNGEIVLSKGGQLFSCSCAAGPALEGMNISSGMRAAKGAIEGIEIRGNEISLRIIDDVSPVGICGSGILDAVSELLRVKLIGKTGRLKKKAELEKEKATEGLTKYLSEENGKRKIYLGSNSELISITQDDIRQVQLAKGAISSGFYALLELAELEMQDLDEVIIAGQFGKHLKVDSLVGAGIIPANLKEKIRYIGNSSKAGALMCLLSQEARKKTEEVPKRIHHFELSTKPGYEKLFTRCLSF